MQLTMRKAFCNPCGRFPELLVLVLGAFALLAAAPAARGHGEFHGVILAADQDIAKDPKNPELYLRRAELFRIHQQFDSAQADIAIAEKLSPAFPVLDIAKARLLLDTGWPLSARAHLDRFLQASPRHLDALVLRSQAWNRLGQPLYAAEDLNRAIAVTPEGAPDLYIERAHTLASAGLEQIEAAIQGIDDGVKRMGPLVTLELTAIELELRRNNHDAALARVDTVLERSPRKESWLARKAEILLQAGRAPEARKAYAAALSALNTLPPARRNVPAVVDLAKRIQLELDHLNTPGSALPDRPNP
jgi:tetratricopeptide (TPR) repeat protein